MRGSRNFCQGVGSRPIWQTDKKALTTFFFFFFSWSSAYFKEVKWSISKKSIIFQGSRGGPTFSRGVQLFPGGGGGSNCLFPIETHITCDFPGGSGPPVPPSGSALESAWLETERPRVRASQASLSCGPWARHIYPSLVLVQPRKIRTCLTERLLMGR